jgi:carboxylate-amine ligase
VPTYDLGDPPVLAGALERLTELVVKPRFGHGGRGVVVCAHAEPGDLDALQRRLQHEPEHYVAQDLVVLSRHPTVSAGTMQPGHVDLRALAAWRDADCSLLRGGLTRYARAHGAMVVNSWQGGGAKHAWVLA